MANLKVKVCVPVFTEREVEIPESCPECSADFRGPESALMEWDLHDIGGRCDPETGELANGFTEDGDDYHPVSFWCGECFQWNTEGDPDATS